VLLQVSRTYAWVAMHGLDHGGFRAMLHRNDFSVTENFRSLQVSLPHGRAWLTGLLSSV
jgi:hypothetical protein